MKRLFKININCDYFKVYVLLCWIISPILPIDIIIMLLTLDLNSWFQALIIEMNPLLYEICSFLQCELPNRGWKMG